MKMLIRVSALALMLAATACAYAKSGDQSLVSPSKPHAIISTAMPPGPSHYRVKIVWLDGNYLSNPHRTSFWVKPGTHVIGFRAIINTSQGPSVMSTPATSGPRDLVKMKMTLERGYIYYFAAKIPKTGNASNWSAVLLKKEKAH
ncbi:MAG TPA: hypothetical protein VFA48_01225 [Gammaproteobacteria bacterium]|nr:hypothetical protein [Gammaproteobacteria bacterium]